MDQVREAQAGIDLYEPGKSAETANSMVRLASASQLAPLATIWPKIQSQNSPYIPHSSSLRAALQGAAE